MLDLKAGDLEAAKTKTDSLIGLVQLFSGRANEVSIFSQNLARLVARRRRDQAYSLVVEARTDEEVMVASERFFRVQGAEKDPRRPGVRRRYASAFVRWVDSSGTEADAVSAKAAAFKELTPVLWGGR